MRGEGAVGAAVLSRHASTAFNANASKTKRRNIWLTEIPSARTSPLGRTARRIMEGVSYVPDRVFAGAPAAH